jgi:hypothetical protein
MPSARPAGELAIGATAKDFRGNPVGVHPATATIRV